MPTRTPVYTLPPIPAPPDQDGPLAQWARVLDGWRRDVEDVLQRNFKQLELVPHLHYAFSTAGSTLTTSQTTVPSLNLLVNVPSGADVHVVSFLDVQCDTASVSAVGLLRVTYPTGETSVQPQQIVNVPQNGAGGVRGTFGQQWRFADGPSGAWRFEMLAVAGSTAGALATLNNPHCTLSVQIS